MMQVSSAQSGSSRRVPYDDTHDAFMTLPFYTPNQIGRSCMNTVNAYPMLSERSRGWLKYLHRKVNTPDDLDRRGHPSEMWDDKSTPPMLSFARFDLIDSSYA